MTGGSQAHEEGQDRGAEGNGPPQVRLGVLPEPLDDLLFGVRATTLPAAG